MAIQPIDLQTLYTQMDKVGKQQSAEQKAKENQSLEQSESLTREQLAKESSVQEAKAKDQIDVNKDGRSGQDFGNNSTVMEKPSEEKKQTEYFKDPTVGRKIDFIG